MTTQQQFEKAYNSHLPNGFTRFMYRYFSVNASKGDRLLSRILVFLLVSLFSAGMLGTILEVDWLIRWPTIVYSLLLVILGICMFTAWIMNRIRIKKICRDLGITMTEYNTLVILYIKTEDIWQ
jgi:hypothetical protein